MNKTRTDITNLNAAAEALELKSQAIKDKKIPGDAEHAQFLKNWAKNLRDLGVHPLGHGVERG